MGGGALRDVGIHLADLLLWIFGDVRDVKACLTTHMANVNKADDVASVSLKFENGIVGQMFVSWVNIQNWDAMQHLNCLQVLGDEGVIDSSLWGPNVYYFSDRSLVCRIRGRLKTTPSELDPRVPFIAKEYAYKKEITSFLDSIMKDEDPPVQGIDGRRALSLILRATQSAQG
jgi:predicted dehydrogenase